MSARVKDMCTIVEVPMNTTHELSPTHIRAVELHFAVLKKAVKHLEWDS
jgi:hypothetical protein